MTYERTEEDRQNRIAALESERVDQEARYHVLMDEIFLDPGPANSAIALSVRHAGVRETAQNLERYSFAFGQMKPGVAPFNQLSHLADLIPQIAQTRLDLSIELRALRAYRGDLRHDQRHEPEEPQADRKPSLLQHFRRFNRSRSH